MAVAAGERVLFLQFFGLGVHCWAQIDYELALKMEVVAIGAEDGAAIVPVVRFFAVGASSRPILRVAEADLAIPLARR